MPPAPSSPSSPADAVRSSSDGGVVTLTMDQPHNRNAMTTSLLAGLGDGLAAAVADPAVRAVVVTHTGPVFSAGADLSSRGRRASEPGAGADPAPPDPDSRYGLADVLAAIQDSPKPVIARIAGHCLGGGVGLAAACDLSIASEDARFGFTEVRLGVIPAIISVVCLPKLRRSDALELFLTGQRIGAARAAAVGLITAAVPAGDLDTAVDTAVGQVLAGGPQALAAAKRLVYDIPTMGRAEAFVWTTDLSASIFASDEAAEGIAAFREKRQPSWQPPSPD